MKRFEKKTRRDLDSNTSGVESNRPVKSKADGEEDETKLVGEDGLAHRGRAMMVSSQTFILGFVHPSYNRLIFFPCSLIFSFFPGLSISFISRSLHPNIYSLFTSTSSTFSSRSRSINFSSTWSDRFKKAECKSIGIRQSQMYS